MDKEFTTVIADKKQHSIELINIAKLIKGEQDRTTYYSNQDELDQLFIIFKKEADKKNIPIKLMVIDTKGNTTTINYNFDINKRLEDKTILGDKSTSVRYRPNRMVSVQLTSKELLLGRMKKWHKQYELGFITEEAFLIKLKELKDNDK